MADAAEKRGSSNLLGDPTQVSGLLLDDFLKDTISDDVEPSAAYGAALFRAEVHLSERARLERQLSPEERKELLNLRLAISISDDSSGQGEESEIDRKFPDLAKQNREIEAALETAAANAPAGSNSGSDLVVIPQLSQRSAIQCHVSATGESTFSSRGSLSAVAKAFSNGPVTDPDASFIALGRTYKDCYTQFIDLRRLSREYGANLAVEVDGQTVRPYFFVTSYDSKTRLPVDPTREAEPQLLHFRASKIKELEQEYNFHFATAGESVLDPDYMISNSRGKRTHDGLNSVFFNNVRRNTEGSTRSPFIYELVGVEEALKRSYTSASLTAHNEVPLRLSFVRDEDVRHDGMAGYYRSGDTRQPTIAILKKMIATDRPTAPLLEFNSLKQTLMHELAHHHQHIMGWGTQSYPEHLAAAMGWRQSDADRRDWTLACKDNQYYKNKHTFDWYRCDTSGRPLNTSGQFVSNVADAEQRTATEVRKLALVKPITAYFTNPLETYAEAITAFAGGEQYRGKLLRESPQLYDTVKEQDQLEIDRFYKIYRSDKQGIRTVDGTVIDATPELAESIAQFENKLRSFPARLELLTVDELKKYGDEMIPLLRTYCAGNEIGLTDAQKKSFMEVDAILTKRVPDTLVVQQRLDLLKNLESNLGIMDPTDEHSELSNLLSVRATLKAALASSCLPLTDMEGANEYLSQIQGRGRVSSLQLSDPHVNDDALRQILYQVGPGLVQINLHRASVSDDGLTQLRQMSGLEGLTLGSDNITGTGLSDLADIRSLFRLKLTNPAYGDVTVSHLKTMPQLLALDIATTQVTDKFMERITDFPNLESLVLPVGITQTGLAKLPALKSLRNLTVTGSQIDDRALEQIANCNSIRTLDISNTAITESGMKELRTMANLTYVTLPNGTSLETVAAIARHPRLKEISVNGHCITSQELVQLRARQNTGQRKRPNQLQ